MSRILVLGAGRGQVGLIQAIKRYGHTAVVASVDGKYPGFKYADEIWSVDISNPIAVDEIVRKNNIQGVSTCCMDTGMETLGYLCDKYGFMGPTEQASKTARDKYLMKEHFVKGNVKTPKCVRVFSENDLAAVFDAMHFPVVVKAVDQQGSLGINMAISKEQLSSAYKNTMEHTKKEYCIVEEYIVGEKHGANGCIVNGELLFLLPSRDLTEGNSVLGHVLPFTLKEELSNEIIEQITKAVHSIGLNNCVFNVDYIIQGCEVYIIEITGRLGANGIPELLSIYYGIDIYRLLVDIAVGIDPTEYFKKTVAERTPCCSKMIASSKEGILKAINNTNSQNENIAEISYFVSNGDRINRYRSAKDCLGQIIVKGQSPEDCLTLAKKVESNIEFELEEK